MSELASQLEGKATTGADPVAVTAATLTVLAAVDVQLFDRFTVYVQNVGGNGGHDIESVVYESAPTADGPWVEGDTIISADPLAAGSSMSASFSALSHKYIRLRAACGAGHNTTARFWLCVGGQD